MWEVRDSQRSGPCKNGSCSATGGTAGCVLASRLSEDSGVKVLVIERGSVADTWASKVPMISANTFREGGHARRWFAQPLAEANDRCLEVVCGEGIGGTSRINGMLYTRGAQIDSVMKTLIDYPFL